MKKVFYVLFVVLMISACGANEISSDDAIESVPVEYFGKSNPLGADAAEDGAVTFKSTCASCHGEEGRGDGVASASLNPPPKNLAELQMQVGDDYLFWKISDGSIGTAMVPWRGILTEEQIWELVAFVRTLK